MKELQQISEALKELSFAAQTTGGVAGRDDYLISKIDAAQKALTLIGELIEGEATTEEKLWGEDDTALKLTPQELAKILYEVDLMEGKHNQFYENCKTSYEKRATKIINTTL